MNKFLSMIFAATIGVATAIPAGSVGAAQVRPAAPAIDNLVTTVQTDRLYPNRYTRHRFDGRRHYRGRDFRHYPRYHARRGHYGPRHYYPRYRHRNDIAPIIGGLAAGAIIGGVIANQAPRTRYYRGGDAHVQWCLNRYRSYDVRTDTFQPYHGPRRYCNSPYR